MKRVLITGANSYIGTSFEKYIIENDVDFEIDTLDLLNPKWVEFDFSPYDSIFHVAAIVHKNEKN
ncbi:TPA: NAD-dependent epimerase, partial [Streptococcus suis]